jgi:DNA-binding NarL/FixJ family response regulator
MNMFARSGVDLEGNQKEVPMSMALRRGSPLRVVSGDHRNGAQGHAFGSGHSVNSSGNVAESSYGSRRRGFLIVDPQALVRHGLVLTLSSLYDGAQTWQAGTAAEAFQLLGEGGATPDLVLMDADGFTDDRTVAVVDFLATLRGIPAIIMAGTFTAAEARTFLSAGATACLLKSDPSAVLANAIALALTGEGYLQLPYSLIVPAEMPAIPDGSLDQEGVSRLTNRQRDIFRLLLQGCSNKEIARRLGVLEGTVKVHVRAMMQKLGARNRTQIAILAARSGVGVE